MGFKSPSLIPVILKRIHRGATACFWLLTLFVVSYAAAAKNFKGLPYYRFYGSKDFDSSASARFVKAATDGSIIYGDQNWLFFYNGVSWRKLYYSGDTRNKITAIHWDDDGRIYVGAFNSIGTIEINEDNVVSFKPLTEEPISIESSDHFDEITADENFVYFEGKRTITTFNKHTEEIISETFPSWITASFIYDGIYHVITDFNVFYQFRNGSFEPRPELNRSIENVTITATTVDEDGSIIMGSERRGLYRYDGTAIVPAYPNFKQFKDYLLTDISLTSDGDLLVALMGKGIVVLDDDGNTLEELGDNLDYRFKSARSVMTDKNGATWAMFNSSLAKILLDSPLTAIDERLRPSLFYATLHPWENEVFMLNFYIFYEAEFDANNRLKGFRNVFPDADFEVSVASSGKEGIYLGTNDGKILLYQNGELAHMADTIIPHRLEQVTQDPSLLITANSSEIVLFEKAADKLIELDRFAHEKGFINRLKEDGNGVFWAEHGIGAAGRVKIVDRRIQYEYYDSSNGLSDTDWMTLWMHEGKAYFTESRGAIALNEDTLQFELQSPLEPHFQDDEIQIARAITDPEGNVWVSANDSNVVLWKQEDGSYLKDAHSLSEMGEPYIEFVELLEGDQALLMTSFELFHYSKRDLGTDYSVSYEPTRIASISDLEGKVTHFTYLGDGSEPETKSFEYSDNSLAFVMANSFSQNTRSPEFQYYLKGFSKEGLPDEDSVWNTSSEAYFTNLDHGDYTLMARAKLGDGHVTPWTEYSFRIEPPFRATIWAYLIYAVLLIAFVLLASKFYSRQLKFRNLKLKQMVDERTSEIESKNQELEKQAEDLAATLNQLHSAQDQLLTTARKAGMAEVATNVLHNVGNVLNSVNISIANLGQKLSQTRIDRLKKIVEMLQGQGENLADFIIGDPRGRSIPAYLDQYSNMLEKEFTHYTKEVSGIESNVEHIKRIIATQQTYAKNIEITQSLDIAELVETAATMALGPKHEKRYEVDSNFESNLVIASDRHKVLEILTNFFKNAKESIDESNNGKGMIRVHGRYDSDDEFILLSISDNGVGIDSQHLNQVFNYGFTTKEYGHGFGLHSCANAVKTLGGDLSIDSPGSGKGATITLRLPRSSRQQETAPQASQKVEA